MDTNGSLEIFVYRCSLCSDTTFSSPETFAKHLRTKHCSQEGGSFVCLYGENEVCSSLPVDGISDVDYEQHIQKHHISNNRMYLRKKSLSKSLSSLYSLPGGELEKWDLYSASQNLAAILNNPNKIKPKDFFTKTWGENFIELNHIPDPHFLPTISSRNFDDYLKKVLKRYRRRGKLQKVVTERSNSLSSQKSLITRSDKFSLDIPDIFVSAHFDLSNPDTFNKVFPHLDERTSPTTSASRPHLIQEKLAHYLDIVEVEITKQVSSKSDAFFHTMTSHDALMENLGHTLTRVSCLRSKIREIDNTLVKNSLLILKGVRSCNNYRLVLKKFEIMATVCQTQPTVNMLLSNFDYVAALDLIYTTKDLLNNELAGVQCFRHLSSELTEVIKKIDALMMGELESYAASDLNRPLANTGTESETLDKNKLLSIVLGMMRRQHFSFIDSYWREASATIKAVIKQSVIEIVSKSDSPSELVANVLTLDEQLKLLTVEEWVSLLKNTAHSLSICLRRIKSISDTIHDAISLCYVNSEINCKRFDVDNFLDEENYKIATNKLNHLITSSCQYVSERYSHLLSKRSLTEESNSKNSSKTSSNNHWLAEQATLAQLNDIFMDVETVCSVCQELQPKNFNCALKTTFKSEVNKFVKKFHEDRSKKIDLILENETWKQTPVPIEFQTIINEILETGRFTTYKTSRSSESENSTADVLRIQDQTFVVIGTVPLLINTVSEYCVRAGDRIISSQSLLGYLADILQQFNRKSCKLVLGGEAVSGKTGLKKITSTNLAILMRTLQLILELIPLIKKHFAGLLIDTKLSLNSLDRVRDEILAHIRDIRKKLLFIPSQIISTELSYWEAKPPVPSKSFQNLSTNLKKLHDAVACILVQNDVYDLYRKINSYFKDILRDRIMKMNIINNGGPQHGVVITELIFYLQDLKKIGALPENELSETWMDDLWTKQS